MNLQDIRAFLKVSETGSFSRAAETLHITQPAISKRIASLEQSLNTNLFDRVGKQVFLTEAGKTITPFCRRIISELEESRRQLSTLSTTVTGTLGIATSHHIGLHRLPPVLKKYTQQYPDVELDIRFMDSETACKQVLEGKIEMAIVTLPEDIHGELTAATIWNDEMEFVVSIDHPLAKQKAIKIADLISYPSIMPSHGTITRAIIENTVSHSSINVLIETSYLETIKAMVQIGLGWSMLPKTMLDKSLKKLNIPNKKNHRKLGVVLHKKRTCSNASMALVNMLK